MSAAYTYPDIAKMIDHSLLNPALTVPELEAGCELALRYDVASVCILPYYAARCAAWLAGSTVHNKIVPEKHGRGRHSQGCFKQSISNRFHGCKFFRTVPGAYSDGLTLVAKKTQGQSTARLNGADGVAVCGGMGIVKDHPGPPYKVQGSSIIPCLKPFRNTTRKGLLHKGVGLQYMLDTKEKG